MDLVDLVDDLEPSEDDGNDGPAQRLQEVELELAQASWVPAAAAVWTLPLPT